MRKPFRIVFLLLCVCFGISFQVGAQENYEIRSIDFHGNKTLDKDFLLEGMVLKEVPYLKKILTKEEPSLYNRELLQVDMERLTRIYQREGFLNVKAKLRPLTINDKRHIVRLDIDIDEGKPVKVDTVKIDYGNKIGKLNTDSITRKVVRKFELKKGDRFRDDALQEDLQSLEDAFKNLGYAYVQADYHLDLDTGEYLVGIQYSLTPGPVCHIGETSISGNDHVKTSFIQKQFKYHEGEIYNRSLLAETRQNLYNLQLFRIVSVLPEQDEKTQKNPIPVKLYLEEAPRLSTKVGAGYGTEDKFRAFLDMNYRGFLGGARRINLNLKHSALTPYSASLKWIQPQFFSPKSTISLNPFINRAVEPGYKTRTYGINVPVTYQFNSWLTGKLTYYLENVKQQVEQGDAELPNRESRNFPYSKSGILLSGVFDNSNPKFSPERGVNFSLGFKQNGHVFGGAFSYTRFWADVRTYHQIGDWVLAFRGMAGGITSADSSGFIPVEDRFYSGGSNSVRGWSRSQLGPKRASGTPLGGKSIVESNLELRYPLFWRLSGVAFMDAGNVWRSSYAYHLNQLAYAAGGGLRIDTPIGPIRLDLGFPLWNVKKSPQFFISVGQAF